MRPARLVCHFGHTRDPAATGAALGHLHLIGGPYGALTGASPSGNRTPPCMTVRADWFRRPRTRASRRVIDRGVDRGHSDRTERPSDHRRFRRRLPRRRRPPPPISSPACSGPWSAPSNVRTARDNAWDAIARRPRPQRGPRRAHPRGGRPGRRPAPPADRDGRPRKALADPLAAASPHARRCGDPHDPRRVAVAVTASARADGRQAVGSSPRSSASQAARWSAGSSRRRAGGSERGGGTGLRS